MKKPCPEKPVLISSSEIKNLSVSLFCVDRLPRPGEINIPDDAFAVPFADVTFGAESAAGKLSFENQIVEMDFPVDKHRLKGGLFISEGGSAILNFLRAISRARRILELLDRVRRLDLVRERVVRSQTRRLVVIF